MNRVRNAGFTLIELLLVVAILAILTALVLPKLDGLQSNANHGVGAASANDTGRFIQIYRSTKNRLPDGWDTLMDATGTAFWQTNNPGTTPVTVGLHAQVSTKFQATPLGANQITSLASAGISTVYNLDAASTLRPGDRFGATVSLTPTTTGQSVAEVSPTGGKKIIDHIYRDNTKSGGVSGTIPAGKTLIAFGFGPHNGMVGKTMLEVPYYPNVDPTLVYNRNLVVFEVPTTASGATTRAVFKAVLGTDGDLLDDMATDLFKDVN